MWSWFLITILLTCLGCAVEETRIPQPTANEMILSLEATMLVLLGEISERKKDLNMCNFNLDLTDKNLGHWIDNFHKRCPPCYTHFGLY